MNLIRHSKNKSKQLVFFIKTNLNKLRRLFFLYLETLRYSRVVPEKDMFFWVVSCERNVGEAAIKCLESVYVQNYKRNRLRHLFIDDASTDGTDSLIRNWQKQHPDHNVEFIFNKQRAGGTANTIKGFRMAPPNSIILELNGDDWLPDSEVVNFLNKVYDDPKVWMTYNTYIYSDSRFHELTLPYPRRIVATRDYRRYHAWAVQHLHSFRSELFGHLQEETFIDPRTGEYWESADDQAIYLSMLELAGDHAKHIYRTTYVYNYHDNADNKLDHSGSVDRAARIRQMKKYPALDHL